MNWNNFLFVNRLTFRVSGTYKQFFLSLPREKDIAMPFSKRREFNVPIHNILIFFQDEGSWFQVPRERGLFW